MPVPGPDNRERNWLQTLAKVGTLGTDMVIFAGLGFWLGKAADDRFGWQPWGTFSGLLLGCIAGFWSVCGRVMKWK